VFVDGSTRLISSKASPAALWAMLTIAGHDDRLAEQAD